jgi:hypothetical protein
LQYLISASAGKTPESQTSQQRFKEEMEDYEIGDGGARGEL